ncbi:hypothetical protein ACFS7Z_24165 [Pontibacter toksunensis]|uniref:SGNH/GDSL hydrolase family protein n=1 Tax=Pontibacter toksunensis TaxID=1332631 RepID=A0ABW6C1A4_9BACT
MKRKFLLKILGVGLATALAYFGIIFLMLAIGKVNWLPNARYTHGGYGHTLVKLQEAKQVQGVDMLFIGSSHVYRGFDPRIFNQHNIRTFNLGTPSQTPFVSYYLLKEHLPAINPRYVVMDLYWNVLSMPATEAGADVISNSEIRGTLLDMVWESRDIVLLNSFLISYINQMISPLDTSAQKEILSDEYIGAGYVASKMDRNLMSDIELAHQPKYRFTPNKLQVNHLKKIINLCKKHNVELIFVVTPVTKEYFNSVQNYQEFTDLAGGIASDYSIPLIDYNTEEGLILDSQSDFYDKDHLSQAGVEKFNAAFIKKFYDDLYLNNTSALNQ